MRRWSNSPPQRMGKGIAPKPIRTSSNFIRLVIDRMLFLNFIWFESVQDKNEGYPFLVLIRLVSAGFALMGCA